MIPGLSYYSGSSTAAIPYVLWVLSHLKPLPLCSGWFSTLGSERHISIRINCICCEHKIFISASKLLHFSQTWAFLDLLPRRRPGWFTLSLLPVVDEGGNHILVTLRLLTETNFSLWLRDGTHPEDISQHLTSVPALIPPDDGKQQIWHRKISPTQWERAHWHLQGTQHFFFPCSIANRGQHKLKCLWNNHGVFLSLYHSRSLLHGYLLQYYQIVSVIQICYSKSIWNHIKTQ